MLDFSIITGSLGEYGRGLWLTVQLLVLALATGLTLAIPLAVARAGHGALLSKAVWLFTWTVRGTPMLVQLLMVYYGLSQFAWMQQGWADGNPVLSLFRSPYFCAWLAFSVNTCAYTTEIIAGALKNVPNGEVEAARAIGMSRSRQWTRIMLPDALRRSLPAYSNEVILMLHGSAIASVVTLTDLTGAARNVYSSYYAPFEAFIFAGLIYLAVTFTLVGLFRVAERRFLAFAQHSSH